MLVGLAGVVENSPGKGKCIMKASPNFRLGGVKDGIYGGDHVLISVLLITTAKAWEIGLTTGQEVGKK